MLVRQELRIVDDLFKQKLSNLSRLLGMQREAIRFESDISALAAQAARVESQIAENELQILEIDQRHVVEAARASSLLPHKSRNLTLVAQRLAPPSIRLKCARRSRGSCTILRSTRSADT